MHNTTEIQRELIRLGFLAQGGDDGILGQASLEAYNHFLASKGKPPHVGMLLLAELNADLFPDEQPVPKPKRNTVFGRLLASFLINQLKGQIPMLAFLDGYKSYGVGAIAILTGAAALLGWLAPPLPVVSPAEGWQLVLFGLGVFGIRRAVSTGK